MPNISKIAQQLPSSALRKYADLATTRKQAGIDVIHFNIGQPDLPSPAEAFNVLKTYTWPENKLESFPKNSIAYANSSGILSYRQALIKYYQNYNIELNIDDILITAGASEALSFTLRTIADARDEIIIPEPYYTNYNTFCQQYDIRIVPFTTKIDNNFSLHNIENINKLITNKTKAILICNPGNPTGVVYTQAEINQLADICRKNNLFLIADEVYREFCYDGLEHTSILELSNFKENAIVIDSESKRFSLCGARLGRIVSKNKNIIKNALKLAQARLSVSTTDQLIGAAVCNNFDYIKQAKEIYDKRRQTAYKILTEAGLICSYPNSALYMLVELTYQNKKIDAEKFTEFLIKEFTLNDATILLTPAKSFYKTPSLGDNQVRLAFCIHEDKIKQGCEILIAALKDFV